MSVFIFKGMLPVARQVAVFVFSNFLTFYTKILVFLPIVYLQQFQYGCLDGGFENEIIGYVPVMVPHYSPQAAAHPPSWLRLPGHHFNGKFNLGSFPSV